jgi:hypothetical protein
MTIHAGNSKMDYIIQSIFLTAPSSTEEYDPSTARILLLQLAYFSIL